MVLIQEKELFKSGKELVDIFQSQVKKNAWNIKNSVVTIGNNKSLNEKICQTSQIIQEILRKIVAEDESSAFEQLALFIDGSVEIYQNIKKKHSHNEISETFCFIDSS